MKSIQHTFKVLSNEKLCPRFYKLRIDGKSILKSIEPGQFIHIRTSDSLEPFFRRPFSVYRAKGGIDIFYEVVGLGTSLMAEMKKGGKVDILGPLGNRFSYPPEGVRHVVMIAGGIGVAPFLILSDALKGKYDLTLLYGGRTRGHTFNMKEFKKNGCCVYVATNDGSVGVKGRVSELFDKITSKPKETMIYTCGPKPMMASVQRYARKKRMKGEAACEEVMACGLGACLGCSIQTKGGYKTVCYDGPVFDLQDVIFD